MGTFLFVTKWHFGDTPYCKGLSQSVQTGQLGTVPNWVERKYMLEEKVLGTIKKYEQIKSGDTIVLGVSGGPDSICLLNILKNLQNELKIDIVVAHINHMIREEADLETILYNIKVLCLQIKKKAVYLQPANYAVTYKVFINN